MRNWNVAIVFLSALGIFVSLYTLYVEYRKEHDTSYVAFCDISEYVACSKVFMSKYGKGFGLISPILGTDSIFNQPNPIYGILYYVTIIILCLINSKMALSIQLVLTFISLIGCVWLGYVLIFVLKDLCVVCMSMYFVQSAIFVLLFLKRNALYSCKLKTK